MRFLDTHVLFWTFSTIAQALAALVALSAMAAFYVLGRSKDVVRTTRDEFMARAQRGDISDEEKRCFSSVMAEGLWSADKVQSAAKYLANNIKATDLQDKHQAISDNIDRALSTIRVIERGLKTSVASGAIAIAASLVSLPFARVVDQTFLPRWLSLLWLLAVLGAAIVTVFVVAKQFIRWMEQVREPRK